MDSGMRIRVDPELREQFKTACRLNDSTAAQEIRRFMREYIQQHSEVRQLSLLSSAQQKPEEG